MWLPWEYALILAVFLAALAYAVRSRHIVVAAFAGEAAIVSVLYSLWQYTGALSVLGVQGAEDRGAWLWELERTLRLPNELTLQNALVPHSFWTQVSNIYYAGAHVPAMGIFLVWLFARHRPDYRRWRNTLALVTGMCLVIQLLPLAPPRLTDETGMIDTGIAYGQSVYGKLGRGIAGQLQAMPSIHVAWAALIGWATLEVSTSRWRWLGAAHFAATFVVVALTGNHYWLDGIVAMALLWPSRVLGQLIVKWVDEVRPRATVVNPASAEPADHVAI